MSIWNRRVTDNPVTLEEALALYPPENIPSISRETSLAQKDSAGWILSKSMRRLIAEMVTFHSLFNVLKKNGVYGSEFVLIRRSDIEAIDTLWKQFYAKLPDSEQPTPSPKP